MSQTFIARLMNWQCHNLYSFEWNYNLQYQCEINGLANEGLLSTFYLCYILLVVQKKPVPQTEQSHIHGSNCNFSHTYNNKQLMISKAIRRIKQKDLIKFKLF